MYLAVQKESLGEGGCRRCCVMVWAVIGMDIMLKF